MSNPQTQLQLDLARVEAFLIDCGLEHGDPTVQAFHRIATTAQNAIERANDFGRSLEGR